MCVLSTVHPIIMAAVTVEHKFIRLQIFMAAVFLSQNWPPDRTVCYEINWFHENNICSRATPKWSKRALTRIPASIDSCYTDTGNCCHGNRRYAQSSFVHMGKT
jgi:hypothetical protein